MHRPSCQNDTLLERHQGAGISSVNPAGSSRVVKVAAGIDGTGTAAPVRDARHHALEILIGSWINQGQTIATPDVPPVPILTSDVYEWVPGGFFVVHSAFGKIGERTRCTATVTDDGTTQVAHHEASTDGVSWTPSMEVTLRKINLSERPSVTRLATRQPGRV
jgi:hypothetical protein